MKSVAADPNTSPRIAVNEHEIVIEQHQVELFPVIEDRQTVALQHAIGVRFEVSIDGRPQPNLTTGSVGIAESPEAAERMAIAEWYLQFGQSMFDAIANSAPKLRLAEYLVYHGPLGLRGGSSTLAADLTLSAQHTINLLKAVLPAANGGLHVVQATIVVAADGKADGEVRIDGTVSAEGLRALLRQTWPRGNTSYMYKQSFILR